MNNQFYEAMNLLLDRVEQSLSQQARHAQEEMEATDEWDDQSRLEYEQYLDHEREE